MIKKNRGFTLIELIVVITIIAVITVMGTVNYGVTNRKARDSKRMADIEKIRIGLEMARQIGTTYPAAVNNSASALVPIYMSALPKDPKSGGDYVYAITDLPNKYKYSIGTSMEDAGSTNSVVTCSNCNYGALSP